MKKLVSGSLLSLSILISACSSSSSTGTTPGGSDGSDAKSADDTCGAVKQTDVQALLSESITDTSFLGDTTYNCKWNITAADGSADDVNITFYSADSSLSGYNNLNDSSAQPIDGIGDKAYWFQAISGESTPTLVAHKGNATCVVEVPDDPDDLTIKHANIQTVDPSDAKTFVVTMGVLCTEIFAGN